MLPLTDVQLPAAELIAETLRQADLRVGVDRGAEKIGAKIRNAQLEKIPYMLILGPKEVAAGTVSLRSRTAGDQGSARLEDVVRKLRAEADSKAGVERKESDAGAAAGR